MGEQHVAVSAGPSFEDLLSDPNEQFDLRSELLASIVAYASAPPASAGNQLWHPAISPAAHYAWLYAPASTTGATAA